MRLAVAVLACLLLGSCNREGDRGGVRVEDAWIRLPASAGQPGSAYFTLSSSEEGTRLAGVTSPLVRWVEMHESRTKGGVSRMVRTREVEFPSRGKLAFEPGGRHAMLFGIDKSVKPGGKVPLTFAFNTAPPVTVDAEVRSLADEAGEEHAGR
jgi:copper(I)-binding protein